MPAKRRRRHLVDSFQLAFKASNYSWKVFATHIGAMELFLSFWHSHGIPEGPKQIKSEHINTFIADQLGRWKPATANNRYRGPGLEWYRGPQPLFTSLALNKLPSTIHG